MSKIKKIIASSISAALIISGICPVIQVSAIPSKTIVAYEFDSETTTTLNFNDSSYPTLDFACYDGYNNPFLWTDPNGKSIWSSGWYTYTNDSFNGIPSAQEMYISDGNLYMNMKGGDFARIKIPLSSEAAGDKTYNISFNIYDNGSTSSAQYSTWAIDTVPGTGDASDAAANNYKGGYFAHPISGAYQYNKTVVLNGGEDHYIAVRCITGSGTKIRIPSITITQLGVAEITATMPANGQTGVSKNVKPTITFDNAIDPSTISGVKLMQGETEVSAAPSLNAAGTVLTITPASALDASTEYSVVIPNTVAGYDGTPITEQTVSFTTAASNVIAHYTFESFMLDPDATTGNTKNFKADGYDNYVLSTAAGSWINGNLFSQTAESAKTGSYGVQVFIPKGGEIKFLIPKSYNESTVKKIKITVPLKRLSDNGYFVYGAIDTVPNGYSSDSRYYGKCLGGQAVSTDGWNSYIFKGELDLSIDHYLCFSTNFNANVDETIAFDDIVIEEALPEYSPVCNEVSNVITYDSETNTYSKAFNVDNISDWSIFKTLLVKLEGESDVKAASIERLGLTGSGSVGFVINKLPSDNPVKIRFTDTEIQ